LNIHAVEEGRRALPGARRGFVEQNPRDGLRADPIQARRRREHSVIRQIRRQGTRAF
jgi:ABC-type phosphonate transport system ATPase subunit